MRKPRYIFTLCLYVVMACSGILISTDCGISDEKHVDSPKLTLEVRFQDDAANAAAPQQLGFLRRSSRRPPARPHMPTWPGSWSTSIMMIPASCSTPASSSQTRPRRLAHRRPSPAAQPPAPLRRSRPLRLRRGRVSGETLATLTASNQDLQIPLAPTQNNQTFQIPRMLRIAYPAEILAGQEQQVTFTLEANPGTTLGVQITANGGSSRATSTIPRNRGASTIPRRRGTSTIPRNRGMSASPPQGIAGACCISEPMPPASLEPRRCAGLPGPRLSRSCRVVLRRTRFAVPPNKRCTGLPPYGASLGAVQSQRRTWAL
jgi:hypothetical protein